MNTRQKIDIFISQFLESTKNFDKNNWEHLYKLGILIEAKVPEIVETRERRFKYVSWKWYEYILKKFEPNFWWELKDFSPNYQMVKTELKWNNNTFSSWYAVGDSALNSKTNKPLNNLGEMAVNENMRGFAKLASRSTGLFLHLWYEGEND